MSSPVRLRPGTPSPDSAHPTGDDVRPQSVPSRTACAAPGPRQPVLFTAVCVVPRYPPRRVIRTFIPAPLVIIPFAARLAVQRHAVVFVVSKLTQQVPRAVVHAVQVASLVIAVTTRRSKGAVSGNADKSVSPAGMRRQFVIQTDARTLLFAADFHNAARSSSYGFDSCCSGRPVSSRWRCGWCRSASKQKTLPVITTDKPVPLLTTPSASPSPGLSNTSRQYGFHIRRQPHARHKGHAVSSALPGVRTRLTSYITLQP